MKVPDRDYLLPKESAPFSLENQIVDEDHVSFVQGSGHGGSHPHMVHEFVSAIMENRKSHVNAKVAANWTLAEIIAHESTMRGDEAMGLPEFTQF